MTFAFASLSILLLCSVSSQLNEKLLLVLKTNTDPLLLPVDWMAGRICEMLTLTAARIHSSHSANLRKPIAVDSKTLLKEENV